MSSSSSILPFDPRRKYRYYISTAANTVTGNAPDFEIILDRQRLSIPDNERGKCIVCLQSATLQGPSVTDTYLIRCNLPTVNVADNLDKPLRHLGTVSDLNYTKTASGVTSNYFSFHNAQSLADSGVLCSNPFDRNVRFMVTDSQGNKIPTVTELSMVLDIQFIDP